MGAGGARGRRMGCMCTEEQAFFAARYMHVTAAQGRWLARAGLLGAVGDALLPGSVNCVTRTVTRCG